MTEGLGFLLAVLRACLRTRRDLVAETLLLRHHTASGPVGLSASTALALSSGVGDS